MYCPFIIICTGWKLRCWRFSWQIRVVSGYFKHELIAYESRSFFQPPPPPLWLEGVLFCVWFIRRKLDFRFVIFFREEFGECIRLYCTFFGFVPFYQFICCGVEDVLGVLPNDRLYKKWRQNKFFRIILSTFITCLQSLFHFSYIYLFFSFFFRFFFVAFLRFEEFWRSDIWFFFLSSLLTRKKKILPGKRCLRD